MIWRVRAALRSPYLFEGVAAAYAAAYLVWAVVHRPGTPVNAFIADAAFYPLGLTVCWLAARNARAAARAGRGTRTSIAWGLLAGSAMTLWVSGTAWAYFVRSAGPGRTPAWIDGVEYLQLSLTIAACLAFPSRNPVPRARARFWLDVALMLVASGTLAARYSASEITAVSGSRWLDLATVRAALDWAVFFTLAVGVFHKRGRTTRRVVACLLGANVCVLMGDWLLTTRPGYSAGSLADALWFSAWVLKCAAARYAWHRYRLGEGAGEEDPLGEVRGAALPRVIVASAFALLVYQVLTNPSGAVSAFVYAAAAMGTLLVLSQVAALRESRRLFEEQLTEEARFRSLVQNSADIILVTDTGGRIVYVSPSVGRVLGEGAIEVGAAFQDLVPPDDAVRLTAIFGPTPRLAGPLSCRLRTAGGTWRDIEVFSTDLRADPAVGGIVLNGRDVTDRNEVERQLQHAQKLETVSHLAGGLAHDFNNILTAIRGSTELLLDDVTPTSPAVADLRGIAEAVDRAAAVTRKLLAFSRRQPVDRTVVDLNALLTALEPLLRQLLPGHVALGLQCDSSLWPIKADPGQIEQVVINLATNARDAMPRGGHLRVETANRTVRTARSDQAGLTPGDYVSLIVSDDGVGMGDEVRRRMFEPFFSTKARDQGVGLGLAMVHGIVAQCDGHIIVDTAEGRGTTFTVLFPRSAEALEEPADAQTPARLPLAPRRVLLVDDEPGVRTVVRRMLEHAGYEVLEASGGLEALAVLDREPVAIDLLLTDLVMPGMHGQELIARFLDRCPGTPVICMTGLPGAPAVPATVVAKPFSSEVLMRAISSAIGS
jgi:PAS domain S-box-containing protein